MPASAANVLTAEAPEGDEPATSFVMHNEVLLGDAGFSCFSRQPVPGDAMLIGLSDPVPSNIV